MRKYPEAEDKTRTPFQRDRDRILHTQAFRRLKGKTQVFVSGHGDHYRTRITHTLEVAQISRDVARTIGLNEDLVEAIALAHDLGHTPFGHAGEDAMRECMKKYGKNFEHNEQSLRIVTLLEDRSNQYPGLNLSREILEGLKKHSGGNLSREAQVVNLADEIAYTAHDCDDGVRAKQFTERDLASTKLGKMALERARPRGTEPRGAVVDLLVSDLYASSDTHISFSPTMQKDLKELRDFLDRKLYRSASVLRQANHGKRILKKLFAAYMKKPPKKVLELQKKTKSSLEESVKDYIAGMTDEFAIKSSANI